MKVVTMPQPERDVISQVIAILEETLPHAGDLHVSTPLLDTGILDSISLANLILELEDGLDCQLPQQVLRSANFATPGAIALMCERALIGAGVRRIHDSVQRPGSS